MGMSILNVWITALGDPCAISEEQWVVYILNCKHQVLRWCNRVYAFEAHCGHVANIEIPPGCYIVIARSKRAFSHAAVIEACCDHHVCVKLYVPEKPSPASGFGHLTEKPHQRKC